MSVIHHKRAERNRIEMKTEKRGNEINVCFVPLHRNRNRVVVSATVTSTERKHFWRFTSSLRVKFMFISKQRVFFCIRFVVDDFSPADFSLILPVRWSTNAKFDRVSRRNSKRLRSKSAPFENVIRNAIDFVRLFFLRCFYSFRKWTKRKKNLIVDNVHVALRRYRTGEQKSARWRKR